MEQGIFIFWFIINFILFLLAEIVVTNDVQKQAMYYVVSGVMFLVLAVVSLDVELIVYDGNLATFVSRNEATYGWQYLYGVGISLTMFAICLLSAFVTSYKVYGKTVKGMKLPWQMK